MTNHSATNEPTTHPSLPDPRPGYGIASQFAGETLAQVTAAHLSRPTPCANYNVSQLAAHIIAVQQRVGGVGRGDDPFSTPQEVPGLGVDGLSPAWAAATADQQAVWSNDSVLETMLVLPFATLPGRVSLHIYVGELLTHTWDLAAAIGVEVDWDEGVAAGALMAAQMGLPAEPRGDDVPFGAVVPVADNAPSIDKLVAWNGRKPSTAL